VSLAAGWLVRSLDDASNLVQLRTHYKVPAAMAQIGRSDLGLAVIDSLVGRYQRFDGHFSDESHNPEQSRYCDLYEDLWLAWGAHLLGSRGVAESTFAFALGLQDVKCGGFRSSAGRALCGAPPYFADLRSTCLAGIVALAMGIDEVANSAAKFAKMLLADQPKLPSELLLVRSLTTGQLLAHAEGVPPRFLGIARTSTRPLYYALGLAIAFLVLCGSKLKDPSMVHAARMYATACMAFAPECLTHDYSGKLYWAFSILGEAECGDEYEDIALRIGKYICGRQLADGRWTGAAGGNTPCQSVDLTAEYLFWLKLVG
jgi:hypothetical protein